MYFKINGTNKTAVGYHGAFGATFVSNEVNFTYLFLPDGGGLVYQHSSGSQYNVFTEYNANKSNVDWQGAVLTGNTRVDTPLLKLTRYNSSSYGRIAFCSDAQYTWYEYMSEPGSGHSCPTGGSSPSGTYVTYLAKRDLLQYASGYGWIWESAAESSGSNPTVRMELSSYDGTFHVVGASVFSGGVNISSGATINGTTEFFPGSETGWREGLRIHSASNGWTTLIFCGLSNTGSSGTTSDSWSAHTYGGTFYFANNGSSSYTYGLTWSPSSSGLSMKSNVSITGSLATTGDQVITSDERRKTHIEDVNLSVRQIADCRAATFDYIKTGAHSLGVIAQDWLEILPVSVMEDSEGYYNFKYAQTAMVASIINARAIVALQDHETEQDKEIRELKEALGRANEKIEGLEKEVERLRMN